MSSTYQKTGAAKETLIAAFVELCKEQPYQKVTVRGIARRSGLSTQTFYNNFCDKQDLLAHLIYYQVERVFNATFAQTRDWRRYAVGCYDNFMAHADYLRNIERNSTGIYAIAPIIEKVVVGLFAGYFEARPELGRFDERAAFALRNLTISSTALMIERLYGEVPPLPDVMQDWIIEDMPAVLRPLLLGE